MTKHIVSDEKGRPIAVQIEYSEWQRIERILEKAEPEDNSAAIMAFAGTVKWDEDPVAYQRRLRDEWE